MIAIVLIAIFLLIRAVPSLRANTANFFTSAEFDTNDASHLAFGIRDLFMVTVLSSVFALALAVPVVDRDRGVPHPVRAETAGAAVQRDGRSAGSGAVDHLRVVGHLRAGAETAADCARFSTNNLGWFFLFKQGNVSLAGGGTIFTAGIVLAVMILPIITSVSREVFRQTPSAHIEAAQALGATKWEVVRMTVLPFGRSGVIAASMLGLGRALGETVAVLIILRAAAKAGHWSLFDGGYTFASKIASAAAEFSAPLPTGAYIAAGFVLFALTFIVNAAARAVAGGKVNG